MNSNEFYNLCRQVGIEEKNILCVYRERIKDSNHPAILHIDSPVDSDVIVDSESDAIFEDSDAIFDHKTSWLF